MHHNGFGLQVVVDGRPLPEFGHEGKNCVVAALGRDYAVRLYVPRIAAAGMRYLAVLSVDGLDAINGKIMSPDGPGYILEPCQHPYDIPGFQITSGHVAPFRFGQRTDGYAAAFDTPTSPGNITVVFFEEHRLTDNDAVMWGMFMGEMIPASGLCCNRSTQEIIANPDQCREHKVDMSYFSRGKEVRRFSLQCVTR